MLAANISTIFLVIAITFKLTDSRDCLLPAPPENGYLKYGPMAAIYPKDYNFADLKTVDEYECVFFFCDRRYKIEGEPIICCDDGMMEDEAPSCVKKYCYGLPPLIGNGRYLSQLRIFKNGMKVFAKCADGYRLKRGSWEFARCQRRGNELSWSTDIPICEEIPNCRDPGTPINGARIGSVFGIGETVSFACDEGDELVGSETLTCGNDGVWDAERPRCKPPISCPDPPVGDHVKYRRIKPTKDYFIAGDKLEVVCDEGYAIQKGNDSLSCILNDDENDFNGSGDDGRDVPFWSDDFPSCEDRGLPSSKDRYGGRKLDTNPVAGGTLILYFIFDSSRSVGRINFNMSIDFVKALVKRIGVSAYGIRVGAIAFGNEINKNHLFLPTEFIITEEVLRNLEALKSVYTGRETNIHKALELIHLEIMDVVEATIKRKIPTHIFLLTDGLFNMGDDPTILAWRMRDQGVEFSCVAVSGGWVNWKALYHIASKRTNVYELKEYDQINWMVDQVLNGKVDYSRCGLDVKELENNAKKYWPWMAMLRERKIEDNTFSGFCDGSIIDRNWILTAAHCMFKDNQIRKAKDIIIRLGYTKGNNESFVQDLEIAKIFVHPEFNKLVRFDYDVALIKLKRSAYYHKRVRPICLSPPEKDIPDTSTLYSEMSEGWAIGYGKFSNDKDVDKSQWFRDLREVALEIERHRDCEEGLRGSQIKAYTTRMFCVLGMKDICAGDRGGPFMKLQYNADGESYWIQTGIMSFSRWDSCGVEVEYGYYAKVSVVREWIDNTIKNNWNF